MWHIYPTAEEMLRKLLAQTRALRKCWGNYIGTQTSALLACYFGTKFTFGCDIYIPPGSWGNAEETFSSNMGAEETRKLYLYKKDPLDVTYISHLGAEETSKEMLTSVRPLRKCWGNFYLKHGRRGNAEETRKLYLYKKTRWMWHIYPTWVLRKCWGN